MKKLIIILIGICILGSYAIPVISQAATPKAENKELRKLRTITGKIIKINEKTREITIRTDKTNEEKKFIVHANVIKSLKINEEVIVKFEEGSGIAQHTKVIMKHNNMVKK